MTTVLRAPVLGLLAATCLTASTGAQTPTGARLALVVGEAAYRASPLATTANDAGLVAQTLQQAGFAVTGARDLDQEGLRKAFRAFLAQAQQAGPEGIAVVYLAGYGVQLDGENYIVPTDATMNRDADVPLEALRMRDLTRALAALPLRARIVVLDAARQNPFVRTGQPLAGGLALVDPEQGTLIALNAAPGTVAPPEQGSYGAYAQSLAEMMRAPGVAVDEVFARARMRTSEITQGAEVPWDSSKLQARFAFFDAVAGAQPPSPPTLRTRPLRSLAVPDAYAAALERDTFQGYQEFVEVFPDDPLAPRVRALLAARREALTWHDTVVADTPEALWSYVRRYPKGPHVWDARRALAQMAAALEPPPLFQPYVYEVAPPPPEEVVIVDRPVLVFGGPGFGPPPPPPPEFYLAPRDRVFDRLPPPPPAVLGLLPIPVPIPLPFGRPERAPGVIVPVPAIEEQRPPQPALPAPGFVPRGVPPQSRPRGGQPTGAVPQAPPLPLPPPGPGIAPRLPLPREVSTSSVAPPSSAPQGGALPVLPQAPRQALPRTPRPVAPPAVPTALPPQAPAVAARPPLPSTPPTPTPSSARKGGSLPAPPLGGLRQSLPVDPHPAAPPPLRAGQPRPHSPAGEVPAVPPRGPSVLTRLPGGSVSSGQNRPPVPPSPQPATLRAQSPPSAPLQPLPAPASQQRAEHQRPVQPPSPARAPQIEVQRPHPQPGAGHPACGRPGEPPCPR